MKPWVLIDIPANFKKWNVSTKFSDKIETQNCNKYDRVCVKNDTTRWNLIYFHHKYVPVSAWM